MRPNLPSKGSAQAKAAPTTHPALSRESSASTRPPRLREPCPCSAHHANLRLPRIGFRAAAQSASVRAKTTSTTLTVISRVHSTATVARTVPSLGASRESSSPAHRLSRGYAKCQRAGKNDFYDPHGNLPHLLDRHGRAYRAFARRIILHANLRLPRVGLRAATRCRQCARIRRRKEARRASVRAETTSTTRPVPSR